VFYLKYDMYRNAWPLLAFATYRNILKRASSRESGAVDGHPHPGMELSPQVVKNPGHV